MLTQRPEGAKESMGQKRFTCSWDGRTWAITVCFWSLMLSLMGLFIDRALDSDTEMFGKLVFCGSATITALLLIGPALFAPLRYEISAKGVRVCRLGKDIVVPVERVQEMDAPVSWDFTKCRRVDGSGGIYGWWGKFRSAELGVFDAWVARWDKGVVIRCTDGSVIVLSPDEPEEFVKTYEKYRATTGGERP